MVVLEEHDRLPCHLERDGGGPGVVLRRGGEELRAVKEAVGDLEREDAADLVVDRRLADTSRRDQRPERLGVHVAARGHLEVEAAVGDAERVVGRAPVRHEDPLEGPVALQHPVVEPVVRAAVGPVQAVVRAHDRPGVALLHGRAERRQVDLPERPLADPGVDRAALGLLVVGRKMLHRRHDALALDAGHDLRGDRARQVGVLREVLEVAPVLGHAVDVDRGPEHDVDAAGAGVAADGRPELPRQAGVPGGGEPDRRRVGGRGPVVAHAEGPVRHLDLGDPEPRDGPDVEVPVAPEERELLVLGQPPHEVAHAGLDRRRLVPVDGGRVGVGREGRGGHAEHRKEGSQRGGAHEVFFWGCLERSMFR